MRLPPLPVMRALLAAEFVTTLGAWAHGSLDWRVAGVLATSVLMGIMFSYPEPERGRA